MTKATNKPLVTIITPAYNREEYIERTIRSVLSQDYPNIDYLVIDDGSRDKTLEIIKKYASKIKIISHKNMGEHKTVNKGVKLAKGNIICVLSSDDILLPTAVSKAVKTFHTNPSIIVTYSDWLVINSDDTIKERVKNKPYSFEHMVKRHNCLPGVGTFFKKEIFLKLNGRDNSFTYVSDYDFWLRAGLLGDFIRIPYFLAAFREHPDSTTKKKSGRKMAAEHIRVIDKFYKNADLSPEIRNIKRQAYASAFIVAGICCKIDDEMRYNYFFSSLKLYPVYSINKLIKKIFFTSFLKLYYSLAKYTLLDFTTH